MAQATVDRNGQRSGVTRSSEWAARNAAWKAQRQVTHWQPSQQRVVNTAAQQATQELASNRRTELYQWSQNQAQQRQAQVQQWSAPPQQPTWLSMAKQFSPGQVFKPSTRRQVRR